MGNHYMTVLGTGAYSSCCYVDFDTKEKKIINQHQTAYVQSAVFHMFCNDFTDGDRVTVFVTSEAGKKHLNQLNEDFEKVKNGRNIILNPVDISDGLSPEEQWKNFNTIYNEIHDNECVTVDITHGFRPIPMQMFAILNYAKTLKNIKVAGVYYGVFEQPFGFKSEEYIPYDLLDSEYLVSSRPKQYNPDVKVYYPIVDYTGYLTISELSNAAFTFSETGDAGTFSRISKISKAIRFKDKSVASEVKDEFNKLNSLGEDLNNITESIKCVRGSNYSKSDKPKENAEKSIYQSVKKYALNKNSIEFKASDNSESQALMNIISYMDDIIKENFADILENQEETIDNDVVTGICVVKWCLRYGLIQAGFTALEETVITWLKNLAGDDFISGLIEKSGDRKLSRRELRECVGSIATEYDKINNSHVEPSVRYIRFKEKLSGYDVEKIYEVLSKIKQARNDMNHFGFSTDQRKSSVLKNDLNRFFKDFLSISGLQ